MKSLFLLFVVIVGLVLVKRSGTGVYSPSHKLERIVVSNKAYLHSNGNVFLPRTIRFSEEKVKPKKILLNVSGIIYTYEEMDNLDYWLEPRREAREVPAKMGDEIEVTGMSELVVFFAREL